MVTWLPSLQDSEITYIYSCILLVAIPIIVAGAAYCTVKMQNSRRRKFKIHQEELVNGRSLDKMMVKEWLHQVSESLHFYVSYSLKMKSRMKHKYTSTTGTYQSLPLWKQI